MSSPTQQSIHILIVTLMIIGVGIAIVAWEAVRPVASYDVSLPPPVVALDVEPLETLAAHPLLPTLVPLASPVIPSRLGNRTPFAFTDDE